MAGRIYKFSRDYGLITVSAYISAKNTSRKLIMVLDTGSYLTLIKPEIAEILNYSEKDKAGKIRISSPIGIEKGYRIIVDNFGIGDSQQDNLDIGVIEIHDTYGVDGLIGLNYLDKYNIAINFDEQELVLI